MSLPSPYSEVYYAADGVTTSFAFGQNFTALNETDVKCIIYFEDGTNCVPTFEVDTDTGFIYIVTLTKPDGTILTVPPEGSVVRVFRDTPEAQNITASQLQNYTAKQLEKIFDAIVAMIQENTYTTEHKTVRLTETQRDIFLQVLTELVDDHLLYWDNDSRTIKATEFPHTDVVRCVGGLFFRIATRDFHNYLQWSINQTEWQSLDFDEISDLVDRLSDRVDALEEKVSANTDNIAAEIQVRREQDEGLQSQIDQANETVSGFDERITQNTTDISGLAARLDDTVTAEDKAMPKSYIDNLLTGIYHIKGAVDTVADLPATGNVVGDCYNVLEDANTYIWTEDEEWASAGPILDLAPYRTAANQDVIDAGKQDKLTAGTDIEITNSNVINMTGKFGKTITSSGKNLILKDQDDNKLSETILAVGVDAEYNAAEEDIKFEDDGDGDYSFIAERISAIESKIPDNASASNKFATAGDIGKGTLTIQRNNTNAGTFNANAAENATINISVPTTAADVDALPNTTKYAASMALSINSSTYVVTAQLKDQDGNNLGTAQTIDLPLESVVVSGSYDNTNKKIVLTLKDGSTIDIPVGDLIAGLQAEITDNNKLSADLVDDTTTTHKFVTTQDKTNWDNKVTKTTEVSKVYGTDSAGAQTTYNVDSFGAVSDVKVDNVSVVTNKIANIDLTGKVDKVSTASKVYGTDNQGAQTTYDVDSFGQVDDVKVNNVSVVTSKIANVTVPTKVSDLTNDSGFITSASVATLTDVSLTSLTDGNALVYDADTGKWVNGTGGVSASYNATTKTITFA